MEKVVQVSKDEFDKAQPQVESQSQIGQKVNLVKDFNNKKPMNKEKYLLILLSLLVIVSGALSGYFLSGTQASTGSGVSLTKSSDSEKSETAVEVVDEEGLLSEEGTIVEGGIDGEGTHHLDRDLGPEKFVYLTSVVLDLDNFTGKKVKVWGNAMAGQEAGYLMDVIKVEIIE